MTDRPDSERDQFLSWELAISCLRVEFEAGRKLTPREMIERSDALRRAQGEDTAALLKATIMRLRAPDIAAISDEEAERLISDLGLKHA